MAILLILLHCVILLDSVYGQRINVASVYHGATCTSSSQLDADSGCDKAIDGQEHPLISEFITNREGVDSWIRIDFQNPSLVEEFRILQRCNLADKTARVQLQFSEGSTQTLNLSCATTSDSATDCNETNWEEFHLPTAVSTSYVIITTTLTCSAGAFNGFREIVVLGSYIVNEGNNLALRDIGGTCESSSDYVGTDCTQVIDGVVDPDTPYSWVSPAGDTIGSWIKITLPDQSLVSEIRIMNRCLIEHSMKTVLLEFDDGSSQEMSLNCYQGTNSCCDCPEQIWNVLTLADKLTTSVKITAIEPCDGSTIHNGFQEIEILGIAESDMPCPFGFQEAPLLSSCYKFVTASEDRLNGTQARAACPKLYPGAHLVEINSDTEQDFLARKAQLLKLNGETCYRYITNGYTDTIESNDWYWLTSGEKVVLPHWGPGFPTSGTGELNILLYDFPDEGTRDHYKWANGPSSFYNCYICEI